MELLPLEGATYVTPTSNWKLEGENVVTRIGDCTLRDKFANADWFCASVTTTVKGYVTVLLPRMSVPLIKPEEERVRFEGSEEPDCNDQT